MSNYRSEPASNPFLSDSDDDFVYEQNVDINIALNEDEDIVINNSSSSQPSTTKFKNDPFYKNLFSEIDSSNSDTNYSSATTDYSDFDDLSPLTPFDDDDLDPIIEEEEAEEQELIIDYKRSTHHALSSEIAFQHIFVDNPQQDKDEDELNNIRYNDDIVDVPETQVATQTTKKNNKRKKNNNNNNSSNNKKTTIVKIKKSKKNSNNDDDDGGKTTTGTTTKKTRKPRKTTKKPKPPAEFMLYNIPTSEECVAYCESINVTWDVKPHQIQVFCDYLRAAAIKAQKVDKKKVKKGVAIDGASKLAFGETIYIRGGGVSPGSASDVISKAFHYITGYKRVKRNREKRKLADDKVEGEQAEDGKVNVGATGKTSPTFINNKANIDTKTEEFKSIQLNSTNIGMRMNDSSSDVTTDSDYDSSNTDANSDNGHSNSDRNNNNISTRHKKKRRKNPNNNNNGRNNILPTETGFIPPALLFVVAPIMFVCFIAYGVSSPNNHNAGLLPATPLLQKRHTENIQLKHEGERKMLSSTLPKVKSLESNFNVYSNDKKTVRHLRHAVNAINFVNDVKKKKHVHNMNDRKNKKNNNNNNNNNKKEKNKNSNNSKKHHPNRNNKNKMDDDNHGTHPPKPTHLKLKLFIAKKNGKIVKIDEVGNKKGRKEHTAVGPPKPNNGPILTKVAAGGLRGIIAAITGGATGNHHFATGSGSIRKEIKHFH